MLVYLASLFIRHLLDFRRRTLVILALLDQLFQQDHLIRSVNPFSRMIQACEKGQDSLTDRNQLACPSSIHIHPPSGLGFVSYT